jgi:hypothetical protein
LIKKKAQGSSRGVEVAITEVELASMIVKEEIDNEILT